MDEKQDTAVRHLKKQNSVDNRNSEWSNCKFEHGIGRTANTGEQRSVFAGEVFIGNDSVFYYNQVFLEYVVFVSVRSIK